MNVNKSIAKAIRQEDKSYFFEDYSKQARAVLRMLDKKGYTIVPKEPTEQMIDEGLEAITPGKCKPEMLVENIYRYMLQAAKKK